MGGGIIAAWLTLSTVLGIIIAVAAYLVCAAVEFAEADSPDDEDQIAPDWASPCFAGTGLSSFGSSPFGSRRFALPSHDAGFRVTSKRN